MCAELFLTNQRLLVSCLLLRLVRMKKNENQKSVYDRRLARVETDAPVSQYSGYQFKHAVATMVIQKSLVGSTLLME